jgi:hypothetical protein
MLTAYQQLQARAPSIPGPPSDPPKPASGDGIGKYKSKKPTWGARLNKIKFEQVANVAETIGMGDAARHMNHYLDNNGKDLTVSVEAMLRDLGDLRTEVAKLANSKAKPVYERLIKSKTKKSETFVSSWTVYDYDKKMTKNWYYAMGAFSFSVSGVLTVTPGKPAKAAIDYKIHVFDRYNWDAGKSVEIGPFTIKDKELGELHLMGLAKEYVVRGTSKKQSVANYKPTNDFPKPGGGGGRDGGRTDPGRDRGRDDRNRGRD